MENEILEIVKGYSKTSKLENITLVFFCEANSTLTVYNSHNHYTADSTMLNIYSREQLDKIKSLDATIRIMDPFNGGTNLLFVLDKCIEFKNIFIIENQSILKIVNTYSNSVHLIDMGDLVMGYIGKRKLSRWLKDIENAGLTFDKSSYIKFIIRNNDISNTCFDKLLKFGRKIFNLNSDEAIDISLLRQLNKNNLLK